MRSVSSATWTLVEPMSCSLEPNFPAISRLRSVVIAAIGGHGSRRPARSIHLRDALSDLACALHVAVHLLDQRLGRLETALAAQALEEIQAQIPPVEVAVEVEDVGLDQLTTTRLKGRAHADRDRRRTAVGETRVDPVTGTGEQLVGNEVGGREAQLAAQLVSMHHLAAQLKGCAQELRRRGHLAGEHQAPDVAGGDDLPVRLQQRVHDGHEAPIRREQPRVALGLVAEAEVLADRHPSRPERSTSTSSMNSSAVRVAKPASKG